MQGVRAYLFDLDGVLIDSYAVWHAVLDATAREFGREALTDQQFADSWGQGIEEDVRKFYPGRSLAEVEVMQLSDRLELKTCCALRRASPRCSTGSKPAVSAVL